MKQVLEISVSILLAFGFLLLGSCAGNGNSKDPNASQTNPSPTGGQGNEESLLIQAVIKIGGASATGTRSEVLCGLARQHLSYMNEVQNINHDGFSSRSRTIQNQGGSQTGEIVASNSQGSLQSVADSCAKQWRNSPGHWEIMEPRWQNFCYLIKRGDNGTYYCIGLVANGTLR